MRRTALAIAAVAASVVGVGVGAAPAWAAAGESIDSYEVAAALSSDGLLRVTERIDYDFGRNQRHGIYRTIPVRYYYDETYERVLRVDDILVSSDAPDDLKISNEGDNLILRIGDEDRTVSGRHTYTISYSVRGAANAFPDHVELSWNVIGSDWGVPIQGAVAQFTMPGSVTAAVCFAGPQLSELPCDRASAAGAVAKFRQQELGPYEALTAVVAAPLDSVVPGAAEPILDEKFSVTRAFAVTPVTASAFLLLLVLGLVAVFSFVWRHGRDRRWAGVTPGLDPPEAVGEEGVERRPPFTSPEGAVEFRPPRDLRPGQVGILLDERADILDVSSTVVDLAVRGYLRIEELPRAHWFASRDWRLARLIQPDDPQPDSLLAYESGLLTDLFATGSEVELSDLKRTFAPKLAAARTGIELDAVRQGFYRERPERTRMAWSAAGVAAVLLGVAVTVLLALGTHLALIGLALVVVGLALLLSANRMPARTAKGSAAYAQVLGFERYIKTAELDQLRYEESVDVFSRYLPFAMVFGETERWAKALAALGAAQVAASGVPAVGWYVGPSGWDLTSLGDSLGSFTTSSASTFAAKPASSGGSSGFSGGGMGGGGGGSW